MSRNEDGSKTKEALPASPTIATNASSTMVASKTCHIVKRSDFEGYGFNLHSEKVKPGQYIGKVDPDSPAEMAGLKEGDRILEVNGVSIGTETHKQVVQRIKAISNEVRLLLVNVHNADLGKTIITPTTTTTNGTNNYNKNDDIMHSNSENSMQQGTLHEIPGESANISSISMISTKRMSNSSTNCEIVQNNSHNDIDSNVNIKEQANGVKIRDKNSNAVEITAPPPPSETVATVPEQQQQIHKHSTLSITSAVSTNNMSATTSVSNKVGSLELPMTAAEMRARLMSKKKYDPKNESVDLKKKFEIIQKL